ncbi:MULTISPECIES: hypothetical protein [unclassified Prochlorococcus]|uniref:hypothetical protein n=1 Tax=unclassified Prochlorococcus TaxID=2627481 RepID=UPI000533AC97|nr:MULTISPECIES: hypothetical protein [unclassified Prochlorococcus]KGG27817.1 hypothetical protein EV12_1080 [Prochlorococcus sp. MIT 0701]KGG29574.1 hypothetical protein EV13_1041 [Prochlorococcus sp. MIT 0702]KGG36070.1 hypothetical protein EV14_0477 [Prochlorococcus sp. MIT 0703]
MVVNSWQQILIDFRDLGGIAENVDLREGQYGRGLFPLDPELPSKIQVPENLLIHSKYLYIDSKEIKIDSESPCTPETRKFIDNYLESIAFEASVWDVINGFEDGLRKLPLEVINILENLGALDLKTRHKGNWEEVIFSNFIQSRFVDYKKGKYLAPIFELINHNHNFQTFSTNGSAGLSTEKKKGDHEFLHSYSKGNDPIRMFFGYGFSSKEPFAFSFPIVINVSTTKKPVRIQGGSGIEGLIHLQNQDNELLLDYLPIGNKFDPTFPIRQLTATLKPFPEYKPREILNKAFTSNQEEICNLLLKLDQSNSKISSLLKEALCYQLSAIAYYW